MVLKQINSKQDLIFLPDSCQIDYKIDSTKHFSVISRIVNTWQVTATPIFRVAILNHKYNKKMVVGQFWCQQKWGSIEDLEHSNQYILIIIFVSSYVNIIMFYFPLLTLFQKFQKFNQKKLKNIKMLYLLYTSHFFHC